jgi:NitT/TauT family transport system substrate-binding protein
MTAEERWEDGIIQAGFIFHHEIARATGNADLATPTSKASRASCGAQFSETPQRFATCESGAPEKIIARSLRTGPYALTSKPGNPSRTPPISRGSGPGSSQPRIVVDALTVINGIDMNELNVANIGFDKSAFVRDEVDAIGGWITNTQALSVVGEDRVDTLLSDLGLKSYANVYFATDKTVETNAELLARFIGAVAKGWGWVHANPEEACNRLVAAYPEIDLGW